MAAVTEAANNSKGAADDKSTRSFLHKLAFI